MALPTVLAALLSLAVLGWLGQPLQLFNVLALLLLVGLGEDYGKRRERDLDADVGEHRTDDPAPAMPSTRARTTGVRTT